jgi:hypothetical protein
MTLPNCDTSHAIRGRPYESDLDRNREYFESRRSEFWNPRADSGCLYHFTTLDTVARMLGRDGTPKLRLNPFAQMNDPWEYGPRDLAWRDSLNTIRDLKSKQLGLIDAKPPTAGAHFASRTRADWSSRSERRWWNRSFAGWAETRAGKIEAARKSWAAACFCQDSGSIGTWQQEAMWSHYADSARGICLVFDKDAMIRIAENEILRYQSAIFAGFEFYEYMHSPRLIHGDVSYGEGQTLLDGYTQALLEIVRDEGLHRKDLASYAHLKRSDIENQQVPNAIVKSFDAADERTSLGVEALVMRKAPGWSYEGEFRIIAYGRDFGGMSTLTETIEIPIGSALRAVICGRFCPVDTAFYWINQLLRHSAPSLVWRNDESLSLEPIAILDRDEVRLLVGFPYLRRSTLAT